jgi:threonine dehydratase
VTEYLYRYDASRKRNQVMLSFNVKEGSVPSEDVEEVLQALNSNGNMAQNISSNGLAKNHVRYMVGGTEPVPYERVFRFGRCDRYTAWV